jgi:hypothetical protein
LILIFFATPVVGFWVASSLAAYLGGPQWMAWTAGALLFPVIPGIWEFQAWNYRNPERKAWLTPVDRLGLRTFAVGLVFLAVLLYFYPQTAFVSLSTRGDWMLDEVKDSRANRVRPVLFAAAGGLEWLYRATKNNPYKAQIDPQARQASEEATQEREQELAKLPEEDAAQQHGKETNQQDGKEATQPKQEGTQQDGVETSRQSESDSAQQPDKEMAQKLDQEGAQKNDQQSARDNEQKVSQPTKPNVAWPWKQATLHPAVAKMPASVETSIKSVARYIAKQEPDPMLRIKALHDYVADRIAYDSDSYFSGKIPDQSAESTFRTRKSVCAGYANLLSALAKAINEKIVVVEGDARDPASADKLTGSGHAWNAARIGQRWYLIDACWDAGSVSRDTGFTKCYRTEYLFPPPAVMIEDHFPDKLTWQLLAKPLSQGEFLRQPMLNPSFQAADLTLVAPQRARNEAGSKAVVIVKNPKKQWLMAGLEQNGNKIECERTATNSETAQLECQLPGKGTYRLNMFLNPQSEYGQYECVGSVDFVNR